MRDRKKIKARHYFELDNRQMIFVFAGFIIVCLFVFTAGVMIGSKMTSEKEVYAKEENKFKAKIKAPSLLEDKKERNIASVSKPVPDPAKTIEDILEKELKKDAADTSTLVQAQGDRENRPDTASRSVSDAAPAGKPSLAGREKEEAFFVQVASFQKPEDADRQAATLKSKGYKVVTIKADVPGKGIWYRLRLGPYKNSADAKSAALEYEKKEKSTTFVTKGLI